MENENKCGFKLCGCGVRGDEKYCSEYCKDAEKIELTEIGCDCDHADCPGSI